MSETTAEMGAGAPAANAVTASRTLADWLRSQRVSLAFTSYQTGQLFLVGVLPNGKISINQQNYARAMGVFAQPGRLYLGALHQVWRLENMLKAGERGDDAFDAVYIPRNAQTTGDIDIHEVAIDREGRVIFVNTKFSCLATLDLKDSFRPIWQPPFISKLAAEDRCHLNGLAMEDGSPRYVTAVSKSDIVNGWRERRQEGGIIVDVASNEILTDRLSMPHSPRIAPDGSLWALDSGRGQIVRIDRDSGEKTEVAFCPGFLRGLAIHKGHAIVTLSKPRDGSFKGLPLEEELRKRDGEAWCGIVIVNLARGDIVEWIRLDGGITEMFDVTVIPDVTCPMSIGIDTVEARSTISFPPLE